MPLPSPSDHRWWELLNRDWQEPGNLAGTLDRIAEGARQVFRADFCSIYAINPLTGVFIPAPGQAGDLWPGEDSTPVKPPRKHGLTRRVIDQGYIAVEDSSVLPEGEAGFCRKQGILSFAAAALYTLRKALPFAVLYVDYRKSRTFDTSFESELKEFVRLASHKLQSTWFLRRYQRIGVIGQRINQSIETEAQLFQQLSSRVGSIIDTSRCFILASFQPEENRLDLYCRIDGETMEPRSRSVDSRLLRLIQRQAPLQICSLKDQTAGLLSEVEGFSPEVPWQPESLLFVPLLLEGRSLGVLSVQHPEPDVYDDEDRHLLALLGSQVALAMSNLRLFGHFRRLLEAGQTLTRKLETEGVLEAIVEAIQETTGCDIAVLHPYVAASDSFKLPPRLSGELREPDFPQPQYAEPGGIAYSVIRRDEPLYAEDAGELLALTSGSSGDPAPTFQQREEILSVAALPLRAGDEPVGILFVNYRSRQQFREHSGLRHLIEGLAGYAAIAIKNARLFGAEQGRHVKNLEILREFDRQLSRSNDLEELLDKILELAAGRLEEEGRGPDEASVLLFNRSRDELVTRAAIGPHRERSLTQVLRPSDEKGITLEVLRTGRSVLVEDLQASRWRDRYLAVGAATRCELDVPLLDGEEVVGILNLESSTPGAFRQADMGLMEILAGQAVLAVKKAQAYEQEKRLREDEETLLDLAKELTQRLDTEELLSMIVERAIDKTRAQAGVLVLVDPPSGDLIVKAESGVEDPEARIGRRLRRGEGILGHVAEKGKTVNADLAEEPWKSLHVAAVQGMLSELAMPLKLQERVLGVLNVESPEPRYFSSRNERLISGLADLALIALQNAERFEAAKKRQEKLEALDELGRKVVDQLEDPDHVMRAIVGHAQRLTGATISDLDLYEGGKWVTHYRAERDETGEPMVAEPLDVRQPGARPPKRGIMRHVAKTKEALLVEGDAQDHPQYEGEKGIRSELAVPLLDAQKELLGVLDVTSTKVGAFDREDQELLQLFAAQAVIAIDNSRSFVSAERRWKRFRLLHKAGQELAQISDLREISKAYREVVEMAHEHLSSVVVVRRLDFSGQWLEKVESSETEGPELYERIPLSDPLNGRAARSGETLVVDDAENPPGDIGSFERSDARDRSFLVAPIKFRDDCFGTLGLSHREVARFKQGEVLLVEGLAQQLAITIHRLEEVWRRREADRRALANEAMSEIGRETYEIMHRLGNDLGLVPKWVRRIRSHTGPQPPKIERLFEKTLTRVSSLLTFSEKLGDELAKLNSADQPEPARTVTPVAQLLQDAVAGLEIDDDSEIEVRLLDAESAGSVLVDPSRMVTALLNLLTNARDAMPGGGTLTVSAAASGEKVELLVSDTGAGVPEKARPKLFRLGFTTKPGGSGFGLWSVKKTLAANSGSIGLESRPGKGTTFVITLPRAEEPPHG